MLRHVGGQLGGDFDGGAISFERTGVFPLRPEKGRSRCDVTLKSFSFSYSFSFSFFVFRQGVRERRENGNE
jgi:hypothetical protein